VQQLPLSRPLRLVDKAAATLAGPSDTTAIPVSAHIPRSLIGANLARLWDQRQPAWNTVVALVVSPAACLAALTANMPSSSKKTTPAATTEPPSKKRKMDATEQKYYAVRAGFKPGVYTTWAICQQQITGFKGAQCMFPSSCS
jgi:hypothetical protein